MADEKKIMKLRQDAILKEREKSINCISHIDDFWILNQILQIIQNITKDTKYESFCKR